MTDTPNKVSLRPLPWLVAVAFFMQTLDSTILNTALPVMAGALGESPLRMHSVLIAYMLTVALLIPASGWLADRFGTRRMFVAAILLFTLGSLACALSRTLTQLVMARVLQGVGGAFLLPVGRLAILRAVPRAERMKTLAFVTIPGLLGPLVGPTLGGWLVEVASWHWVFLINLPVGAFGIAAALRWMPDLRAAAGRFDAAGYLLFSLGLALLSFALEGAGEHAVGRAATLLMAAAGLAAMAGYWLHAARSERPLFHRGLFRIPTFAIGLLGNLFARLGSGAMPFLVPLFLQVGLGYAPSAAGMSMIPTVLGAMLCKWIAVRLIVRLGYRTVLVANTLVLGSVIASFALVDNGTPHAWILVQLFVFGFVNSLQFTAMNTLTLGDLDEATASSGNSLMSVAMQLSMSLGIAAGGALLLSFSAGRVPVAGLGVEEAFQSTFVCVGLLTAVAACIFLQLGRHEAPRARTEAVMDET